MATIKGIVRHIMPLETGTAKTSGNPWKKQQIVVEAGNIERTVSVALTAFNDKTELTKALNIGDVVQVSYNPSSTQWNEKWYTQLNITEIAKLAYATTQTTQQPQQTNSDNLPF